MTAPAKAPRPSGLSVYYPFELVEFLGFFEDEETRAAGELLMSFLDSSGCRVTLRATRGMLAGGLRKRIETLEGQDGKPAP